MRKNNAAVAGGAEDRIYQSIFDAVMRQQLTPGTKLPESALCELFGVGRSSVRAALQRLAHDHIVQLRPHRGAMIAIPSPDEVRELFEARRGLETALVKLAAARATPADLVRLREQLASEHEAMHRFDQPAWARLASQFHVEIGRLARNEVLARYLAETVSRCSLVVALYEPPGNAGCEHDEHAAIVECLARRDGDGAAALMTRHLDALERSITLHAPAPAPSLRERLGM